MELLQLRYFQTVAHICHMTKAAKELHISQPALSKTIHLLEKELNVELFDRIGRSIFLNEYGREFLDYVDRALENIDEGMHRLRDMTGESYGTIRLAVLSASSTVPDLLTNFRSLYPFIGFDLVQHYQNTMSTHDFDLCLTTLPFNGTNVEQIHVMTEEVLLGIPSNHPFSGRQTIYLDEVAKDNFISLKKGTVLRQLTDSFCHSAGFEPNIIYESDDPSTVRGLIRANLGIAFIPEISWGRETGPSVSLLRIADPVCLRSIGLVYRQGMYLSKSIKLFIDFAINHYKELSQHGQK